MSLPQVKFKAVVPARYASTRLPAKPLLDLGGKPMVARVAERAVMSGAEEVWVATDHPDVVSAAEASGLPVLLTRADHPTGTDFLLFNYRVTAFRYSSLFPLITSPTYASGSL